MKEQKIKSSLLIDKKENSTEESMMTHMKGIKTKRLQHPFQVFQARMIIFQKGSKPPYPGLQERG